MPAGTFVTSRPPIEIVPLVTASRPAADRSAVLFPQPDGPTIVINPSVRDLEVQAPKGLDLTVLLPDVGE